MWNGVKIVKVDKSCQNSMTLMWKNQDHTMLVQNIIKVEVIPN